MILQLYQLMKTKQIIKNVLVTSCLLSSTLASGYNHIVERQHFTLSPDMEIQGPILNNFKERERYNRQVVNILLSEASQLAKEYRDYDDYEAYWSFIILSLAVPFHESNIVHFWRNSDPSKCLTKSNEGSKLPSSLRTTRRIFQNRFRKGENKVFPDCSDLEKEETVNTIIHGADSSDFGLMQLNIRWHDAHFVAPKKYLNVRSTANYGLNFIKNSYSTGFDQIYRNGTQKYSCLDAGDGKIDYEKLIRGTWAGKYNSGNTKPSAVCRFNNSNSPHKKKDQGFKRGLDELLNYKESRKDKYFTLKLPEDAATVIEKIMEAFKTKSTDASFLDRYLSSLDGSTVAVSDPEPTPELPVTVLSHEREEQTEVVENELPPIPLPRPKPPVPVREESQILEENVTEMPPRARMLVTASNLNIRNKNKTEGSTVCGKIAGGLYVTVIARYDDTDYVQVEKDVTVKKGLNNKCAENSKLYMSSRFLDDSPQKAVITSGVKIRDDYYRNGAMGAATGRTVGKNTEVTVLDIVYANQGSQHPWYRLSAPQDGWVYGKYIKLK